MAESLTSTGTVKAKKKREKLIQRNYFLRKSCIKYCGNYIFFTPIYDAGAGPGACQRSELLLEPGYRRR